MPKQAPSTRPQTKTSVTENAGGNPLENKNIILVGRIPAPSKDLSIGDALQSLGARVLKKPPKDSVQMDVHVITRQGECDKARPPEAIITACRRQWKVLEIIGDLLAAKQDECFENFDLSKYLLKCDKLSSSVTPAQPPITPARKPPKR